MLAFEFNCLIYLKLGYLILLGENMAGFSGIDPSNYSNIINRTNKGAMRRDVFKTGQPLNSQEKNDVILQLVKKGNELAELCRVFNDGNSSNNFFSSSPVGETLTPAKKEKESHLSAGLNAVFRFADPLFSDAIHAGQNMTQLSKTTQDEVKRLMLQEFSQMVSDSVPELTPQSENDVQAQTKYNQIVDALDQELSVQFNEGIKNDVFDLLPTEFTDDKEKEAAWKFIKEEYNNPRSKTLPKLKQNVAENEQYANNLINAMKDKFQSVNLRQQTRTSPMEDAALARMLVDYIRLENQTHQVLDNPIFEKYGVNSKADGITTNDFKLGMQHIHGKISEQLTSRGLDFDACKTRAEQYIVQQEIDLNDDLVQYVRNRSTESLVKLSFKVALLAATAGTGGLGGVVAGATVASDVIAGTLVASGANLTINSTINAAVSTAVDKTGQALEDQPNLTPKELMQETLLNVGEFVYDRLNLTDLSDRDDAAQCIKYELQKTQLINQKQTLNALAGKKILSKAQLKPKMLAQFSTAVLRPEETTPMLTKIDTQFQEEYLSRIDQSDHHEILTILKDLATIEGAPNKASIESVLSRYNITVGTTDFKSVALLAIIQNNKKISPQMYDDYKNTIVFQSEEFKFLDDFENQKAEILEKEVALNGLIFELNEKHQSDSIPFKQQKLAVLKTAIHMDDSNDQMNKTRVSERDDVDMDSPAFNVNSELVSTMDKLRPFITLFHDNVFGPEKFYDLLITAGDNRVKKF